MRLQPDGRYAAGTLEAEHYSLVACGPDGICAVGVEVGSDPPAPPPPPSEPYEDPYYMELAVAPIDVCGEIVESEILEECPPEFLEPLPCFDDFGYGGGGFAGGGGGGFAGGGGHGFGTGGWGALLGLAGLAGLAALADDDDDGGRQPATPYRRSPTVDSDTESPETETPADESPADESPDGETPDPESEALETGSPGLS